MSYEYEFSNFSTKALNIEFACPSCGCEIFGDNLCVPLPNFLAEKSRDSENINDEYLECPHCEREYDIAIYSNTCSGSLIISDLNNDWTVKVNEVSDYEDYFNDISDILEIDSTFAVLQRDILNLQKLMEIKIESKELENIFYRQIFSAAITCLEDYLLNTLVKNIFNHRIFLINFVEKYKEFSKQTINLSDIFKKVENIDNVVKSTLTNNIMYHNLEAIKPIYEQTFNIGIPDIGNLMKAITKRHDFVHRNGKDRDGNVVIIGYDDVDNLLQEVLIFSQDIDRQIFNQIQNF